MKATALPILAIFLCASLAAPLGAKHPLPGPHYLTCEARGNAVLASWDHLGIGPDLDAKLYRDGVFLASLAPESMSFRDEGVPIGPHAYKLDIVLNEGQPLEQILASKECQVEVLLGSGIRCEVFGGIAIPPRLIVSWDPLPPALQSSIVRFDILIDGNLTASVPPEGLSFEEEPLFGEHSYTVVAVTAAVGPVEPLPGSNIIVGDCAVNYQPPRIGGFVRGDANADQSEDLSDAVFILLYLFQGAPSPSCLKSADTNDDGAVDLSDPVHLLNFLFLGQSPPPMPHPDCDQDPTEDKLSCDAFGPCFNPPPP